LLPVITSYSFSMKAKIKTATVATLIIASTILSAMSFWQSPRTAEGNYHVSYKEINAVYWLMGYRQREAAVLRTSTGVHNLQKRFLDESTWSANRIIVSHVVSHFGYDDNLTISDSLDSTEPICYLYTNPTRELLEPLVIPPNARQNLSYIYTEDDYSKLDLDSAASKIFDNGEAQIWLLIKQ